MPRNSNGNGRPAAPPRAARGSAARDRKLDAILRQAAAVFRARGYHQASIRDIARATGVSLAGLYYYFSSKEELLYLIQRHAFETIVAGARTELAALDEPEHRLRALIRHHLRFFLEHPNEMKVLTHEEEWLGRERGREVRALKRAYYQLCFDEVEALKRSRRLGGLNTRVAVLSLFGMMNWIYTWHNSKVDPSAEECAEAMAGIFLGGIFGSGRPGGPKLAQAAGDARRLKMEPAALNQARPANGHSAPQPRLAASTRSGAHASQN